MRPTKITNHLAGLFDFLDDVLAWVKDPNGRYLWVNRAFLVSYALVHREADRGNARSQVIGKTDYDLSPAFLADQFRLDDEQVLAGVRVIDRIERVGDDEHSASWHLTNKIPVFDSRGRIIGTAGMTRLLRKSSAPTGPVQGFEAVLACMRDNYHQPISNRHLAGVARMSLRAFERQFLGAFHLTPQKYLRKLRLRMASRALIYTNDPLSEVALTSGFADQSHFSREFRRQFGRTPRDYRRHYKSSPAVPGTKSAASRQ